MGLAHRQPRSLGRFLDARLGTAGLKKACGGGLDLGQPAAHACGEPNEPALVGYGPADSLANPPGGVGGKLVPASVVEAIDRSHQAGVALLDQVQEAHAAVAVAFGDGNRQSQVGSRQIGPGGFVFLLRPSNAAKPMAKRGRGLQRGLHQFGQFLLKFGRAVDVCAGRPEPCSLPR